MSYHSFKPLPQFKAKVDLEHGKLGLKSENMARFLKKKCKIGDELIIVLIEHPKKYCEILSHSQTSHPNQFTKKTAWECSCGTFHPWFVKTCEDCGDKRHNPGRPFSKIKTLARQQDA